MLLTTFYCDGIFGCYIALMQECGATIMEFNNHALYESNLNIASTTFLVDITLVEPPISRTKGRNPDRKTKCTKMGNETANPYST
jgi:hypothetical protein